MFQIVHFAEVAPANIQGSIDLVAIAGIIGTLAGAALGAYVTWKVQKLQIEHEDKVRFHDRRLAIYAEFTNASNDTMAKFRVGINSTQEFVSVLRLWETLRLIASEQVVNAAIPIHAALGAS